MKIIELSRGLVTQVDDECFEFLRRFNWLCVPTRARADGSQTYYAKAHFGRGKAGVFLGMHRLIMGIACPMVDHIDGDGLNNQRSNLRIADPCGNAANRPSYIGRDFKGIVPCGKKWVAAIKHFGVRHHLGSFETKEEAARAYDLAATEIYGEFARLNIPDGEASA